MAIQNLRFQQLTSKKSLGEETTIKFSIVEDKSDGCAFAVFDDWIDREMFDQLYPHYFQGYPVVSCGAHGNAFFIGRLH